jgi:hypothetical protein
MPEIPEIEWPKYFIISYAKKRNPRVPGFKDSRGQARQ